MLNPQKRGIVWSRDNLGYVWLLHASLGLNILYFTGMVIWRLEIGILLNVGNCAKTHRISKKKKERWLFKNTRNLRVFEGCVSTWPNSLSCMWWPSKLSVLEMDQSLANKNGISLYFSPSFSLFSSLSCSLSSYSLSLRGGTRQWVLHDRILLYKTNTGKK